MNVKDGEKIAILSKTYNDNSGVDAQDWIECYWGAVDCRQ